MASDSDELLQRYSTTLSQLASTPFDRSVYLERIHLAKKLGLSDEVEAGRNDLADHFPLTRCELYTTSCYYSVRETDLEGG